MKKEEFRQVAKALSGIILNNVKITKGRSHQAALFDESNGLKEKIDLIDRTLEMLRIETRHMENRLKFEDFIQGSARIVGNTLHYTEPEKRINMGSGTAPLRLQSKLLLFLLYRHNQRGLKVYDIIDGFIKAIWDSLDILDFKKTKTGVTRCFTNTRFAANTLRAYGLLEFTKREAYKTWVLSLPGCLVASKLMESPSWNVPYIDKKWDFDLHPDIRIAFQELKSYDFFVQRMASICTANAQVFNEEKEGAKRAYTLLRRYSKILHDDSLAKQERKKHCSGLLKRVEQEPEIRRFYEEFLRCLKAGDLLMTK